MMTFRGDDDRVIVFTGFGFEFAFGPDTSAERAVILANRMAIEKIALAIAPAMPGLCAEGGLRPAAGAEEVMDLAEALFEEAARRRDQAVLDHERRIEADGPGPAR